MSLHQADIHYPEDARCPQTDNCDTGNIPEGSIIIACPTNLHSQLNSELERYLQRGTFDILPYTGKLEKRRNYWTQIYPQSRLPLGRRIILASHTVCKMTI